MIYLRKTNPKPRSSPLTTWSCHMAEPFQVFSASDDSWDPMTNTLILKLCYFQNHGSFQANHFLPQPQKIVSPKPKKCKNQTEPSSEDKGLKTWKAISGRYDKRLENPLHLTKTLTKDCDMSNRSGLRRKLSSQGPELGGQQGRAERTPALKSVQKRILLKVDPWPTTSLSSFSGLRISQRMK